MWINKFGASEAIGELLHIPPTLARKIKSEQQAKMQAMPPPGMGPGGPQGGAPAPQVPGAQPGVGGPPNIPPQIAAALLARMHGGAMPVNGQHAVMQ